MRTTKNRIRQARRLKGLTQAELGKAIGRSAMFISRAESGKTSLKPEESAALASALSVNEGWLRTGEGPVTDHERTRDRRTIGQRLYQVRKENGMNQAEFGTVLGVTRLNISLLERGKINASPKLIATAVEKFHIDEHWLRTGERTSGAAEKIIEWLSAHAEDRAAVAAWLRKGIR